MIIPFNDNWTPSQQYLDELAKFGGRAYKTHVGYRVTIPPATWEEMRSGNMRTNIRRMHNFLQIAWTYASQFHFEEFRTAVDNITFDDQLKNFEHYGVIVMGEKVAFTHFVATLKVEETLESWVKEDLWYDPKPIKLEKPLPEVPRPNTPLTDPMPDLTEASSDSEDEEFQVIISSGVTKGEDCMHHIRIRGPHSMIDHLNTKQLNNCDITTDTPCHICGPCTCRR